MDYLCTFPNSALQFYAGDMQLCVESNAAYLVLPKARSRITGHFYLSTFTKPTKAYPGNFNTPILTECVNIKNVVSSAAEAETATLFHNYTHSYCNLQCFSWFGPSAEESFSQNRKLHCKQLCPLGDVCQTFQILGHEIQLASRSCCSRPIQYQVG